MGEIQVAFIKHFHAKSALLFCAKLFFRWYSVANYACGMCLGAFMKQ